MLSSVAEQPQLPPHPETIAGFNHLAKLSQPCLAQILDNCMKTEFAVRGNTFLKTTTALQITNAATITTSIISISHADYFESNEPSPVNPNSAMQFDRSGTTSNKPNQLNKPS